LSFNFLLPITVKSRESFRSVSLLPWYWMYQIINEISLNSDAPNWRFHSISRRIWRTSNERQFQSSPLLAEHCTLFNVEWWTSQIFYSRTLRFTVHCSANEFDSATLTSFILKKYVFSLETKNQISSRSWSSFQHCISQSGSQW
jgi:hypothetical protein